MKNIRFTASITKRHIVTFLTILFIVVIGKFSFYLYDLNRLIDGMFPFYQGLSSGIYARALELQPGLILSLEDLESELKLLQYRKRSTIDTSGSYMHTGNEITIYTRAFTFEKGIVGQKKIRVSFADKHVASIVDLSSGKFLKKIYIEPLRIGQLSASDVKQNESISIHEVPQLLIRTIIAVEDQNFYKHHGADFGAVLRAMWVNFQKGSVAQGGSTITQQLARHLFFSREQSVQRKIDETILAFILELRLSKHDILEAYINEVYLGQDGNRPIKGFSTAGEYYFGRNIRDLDLNEIALLVGMLKGPSYFNPIRYPQRTQRRRNLVLNIMAQQQLISYYQAHTAIDKVVSIDEPQAKIKFPAFLDLARRHYNKYCKTIQIDVKKAQEPNVRVFTTCDPIIQLKVEEGISEGFKKIEKRQNMRTDALEIGVVVVSTNSCNVLAVVGGKSFRFDGFNRAVDVKRPIGSLIKPAYFLAALEQAEVYNLMTPLDNSPLNLYLGPGRNWAPKNYSPVQQGEVPLYKALSHSYNTASVRLGVALGVEHCLDFINKLGFEQEIQPYPAVLLGSVSMSPLEVAGIYHTLASGGQYAPIRIISSVYDREQTLINHFPVNRERRFNQDAVYLVNIILQKVVSEGTIGERIQRRTKNLHVAGKTGTTDDLRDNWFAGFSGDKLAVVWVGKDEYEPAALTGAQGAFIIWDEVMTRISHIPFAPEMPHNIKWVKIDPYTGFKIEEQDCEVAHSIPYISDFAPNQSITCQEAKQHGSDKRPFNQWLKRILN
jgi:penicillin-binding protein 1B